MGCWINEWEAHDHPRGGKWWWLTGEFQTNETDCDADRIALENNFVTITPTKIDVTDYALMESMKNWNL